MTTKSRSRRTRYAAAQRQEFLAEYRRSGLSASVFAHQNGLKLSTLYQWNARTTASSRGPSPLFKEVVLSGPALLPAWAAEIAISHELTLRLNPQISAEFIAQVIQQLRRPC
jgi:transposase-like protein